MTASVVLKNLSENDYEIEICYIQTGENSEVESHYSYPVRCPVPKIKIINPVPGTLFADSYALNPIIDFGVLVRQTGDGYLHIYDDSDKKIYSQLLTKTDKDDMALNPEIFLNPDETYHIAIDEKAVQFVKDYNGIAFQVPIYFSGIEKSEDTWIFKTVSQSYPGLINPKGDKINEQYYHLLFGNEWEKVYEKDDGSEGHCFGLAYAVGAYENSFSCLKELTSGYSKLSNVPIDEKSKLMEYVRIAHLVQAQSAYSRYEKKDKVFKLFKEIKNGNNVLINIKSDSGENHTIYSLGVIDDSDPTDIKVAVYDSAYPSITESGVTYNSFINTLTIIKGVSNNDWGFKYKNGGFVFSMKDYMEVAHRYDSKIANIANLAYNNAVSNATVTGLSTETYTGHELEPKPTVRIGSTTLKLNTDYTVSYSNNTNAGTATVIITGQGNYTGTITKNFSINRSSQALTLTAEAAVIGVGKTTTVKAGGAKETSAYTYTSSNTAVATVSSSGVVTGKSAGTATITVKTPETKNYKAASKTLIIIVNKTLKKPGNCHFAKWNNSKYTSCRIAWNKVDGAEGYETLLSWTNGSNASRTIVKSNVLYRDCTVHPQHVSQMMVRAFYMSGGKRVFGPWSNVEYITPSPTKLTTKNASSGTNLKMNISWNIIYGCNGYNVFLTTNPNGTWYWNQSTSTKADATSAAITKYRGSKLKKNTRYYVRIVTRRKRNGVFCTVPMPASNTCIGSFIIK